MTFCFAPVQTMSILPAAQSQRSDGLPAQVGAQASKLGAVSWAIPSGLRELKNVGPGSGGSTQRTLSKRAGRPGKLQEGQTEGRGRPEAYCAVRPRWPGEGGDGEQRERTRRRGWQANAPRRRGAARREAGSPGLGGSHCSPQRNAPALVSKAGAYTVELEEVNGPARDESGPCLRLIQAVLGVDSWQARCFPYTAPLGK